MNCITIYYLAGGTEGIVSFDNAYDLNYWIHDMASHVDFAIYNMYAV